LCSLFDLSAATLGAHALNNKQKLRDGLHLAGPAGNPAVVYGD
jgi:hypothetical protein